MSRRLEGLLPGARRTLYLRACLLEGDAARAAWEEWLAGAGDAAEAFRDAGQACLRLAPLLYGVATGPGSGKLGAAVSAALVREELRWRTLSAAAGDALSALQAAGIEAVLVGGVAQALSTYDSPWQRHCHDVDLALAETAGDASRALAAAGFRPTYGGPTYAHASGTRLAVHPTALRSPAHRLPFADLRGRAVPVSVGGAVTSVAAPEHLLPNACEGAFAHARGGSLVWAADASVLAGGLDGVGWAAAVEAVDATRTAVPVAVCLRYLRDRVGLDLPAEPLAQLERLSRARGRAGEDACLALVPRTGRRRRLARRIRRRLSGAA